MEGRSRAESSVTPASHPPPLAGEGRAGARRPRARLYLVSPLLGDTASFAGDITATLAAGDVAAMLLRLEPGDERALINRAKSIAAIVQRRDVALLLDGHPDIVARAGADGTHCTGIAALTAALGTLKPDRIAGAGGLRSRHDAMLAGEAGADYVMFGEPAPHPPPHVRTDQERSSRPPFDALLEQVAWWAELLEPPCIGYAASPDEVAPLAQAGADFVALGDWIWTHAQGPAAAVTAAAARLAEPVR
jgi:thiamine-phosphate pyrophosphorylase